MWIPALFPEEYPSTGITPRRVVCWALEAQCKVWDLRKSPRALGKLSPSKTMDKLGSQAAGIISDELNSGRESGKRQRNVCFMGCENKVYGLFLRECILWRGIYKENATSPSSCTATCLVSTSLIVNREKSWKNTVYNTLNCHKNSTEGHCTPLNPTTPSNTLASLLWTSWNLWKLSTGVGVDWTNTLLPKRKKAMSCICLLAVTQDLQARRGLQTLQGSIYQYKQHINLTKGSI